MNGVFFFSLLLSTFIGHAHNKDCQTRLLSKPITPKLTNISDVYSLYHKIVNQNDFNFSDVSREILSQRTNVVGIIVTRGKVSNLGLNINERLKVFPIKTTETEMFWNSFNLSNTGWTSLFKDCNFFENQWFYGYVLKTTDISIGLYIKVDLNQCDSALEEIFQFKDRCDSNSTKCIPIPDYGEKRGGYRCVCREGYFYPPANNTWKGFSGEDIENGQIESPRCLPCPAKCSNCGINGLCLASRNVYVKLVVMSIHLGCIAFSVILGLIVFKQRKAKTISTGMWTILETILLGICILYSTMLVKFFEPSVLQCILEPWTREVGFIICYGAIILKIYRHLIEFRTRKAHRWVIKDTDLLKYLLIMICSVVAYVGAYSAIVLDFLQHNFSILHEEVTRDGLHYDTCRAFWWDFVTEGGELIILIFGIHLSYACRNARTQFHERNFLCAAISVELAVSALFYASKRLLLPGLHPDYVTIAYCLRTQLTATVTLLLVFAPKFWYQFKQVRSAQEYSCKIPKDAFKDVNAHGHLSGNSSDVEMGEVTLADMNPDDIRSELKRLYLQLEILKSKTICKDNPHISKRRGGRKAAHRRFSLQNFHGKRANRQEEITETEVSRTPEDSVCSIEGPSTIYNELVTGTICSNEVNKM